MSSGCYVFDLEGNGLDNGGGALEEDLDQIWCLCMHDLETGEDFHGDIREGFDRVKAAISNAKLLVCHGEISFDLPVIKRMWGIEPPPDCVLVDTLVWSKALYPDRKKEGGHGLEAWGKRNNCPKPPIDDWSSYDPEKLHRCSEDVKNNVITYKKLLQEASMYDSAHMLWIEQQVSRIITKQSKRGHYFDKERAENLLKKLQKWLDKIDESVAPYIRLKPKQHGVTVTKLRNANGDYPDQILSWYKDEFERDRAAGPKEPHKRFEVLAEGCFRREGDTPADIEAENTHGGIFCRVEWPKVNLNSDPQLMAQLERYGWEPIEYTKKGNPKLTLESLELLIKQKGVDPVLKQLIKRRVVSSRYGMVKGWLNNLDEDGRIRGQVDPQGAVTLRMTHQRVVNVPKYDPEERYSEEYRACFIASPIPEDHPEHDLEWTFTEERPFSSEPTEVTVKGRMAIVGTDAKGIENRMLANRLNNPELTDKILGDLHTLIWKACEPYLTSRNSTKNFEYAFFYGAADLKLGTMLDYRDQITEEEAEEYGYWKVASGKSAGRWRREGCKALPWRLLEYEINGTKARRLISEKIPDLGRLIDDVVEISKQGYLVGFDGRRLIMRRGFDGQVETHKALNTLLQGDGALIMKTAQVFLDSWLTAEQIPAWFINTVHDEMQIECYPSYRFRVAQLAEESIREAGRYYQLNVPLDAEAKIGIHWGHTH